jgi:hypothetical protein
MPKQNRPWGILQTAENDAPGSSKKRELILTASGEDKSGNLCLLRVGCKKSCQNQKLTQNNVLGC